MAVWILIGLISLLIGLTLVALMLAAVLRRVGHDVSGLLEFEPWAAAPPPVRNGLVGDQPEKQIEPRIQEPSWRSSAVRPERSQKNA
jgi:hypothetical protein